MNTEVATFANGCFWCTEAIFKRLKGVEKVISGYTGGRRENPTYEQVSSGATGHAEALQVMFNPEVISFSTLLDIFWHTHNPTTLNQQGNDIGTQYRSAIFYHNDIQKKLAEESKKKLEQFHIFKDPIVTEIVSFTKFYPAEYYHQDYFEKNRQAPYCTYVIDPKTKKLLEEFGTLIKEEYKNE